MLSAAPLLMLIRGELENGSVLAKALPGTPAGGGDSKGVGDGNPSICSSRVLRISLSSLSRLGSAIHSTPSLLSL